MILQITIIWIKQVSLRLAGNRFSKSKWDYVEVTRYKLKLPTTSSNKMACNENGLVRDGTGWNRQKKKINSDVVELIGSGKGLGSGIGNGIGHT